MGDSIQQKPAFRSAANGGARLFPGFPLSGGTFWRWQESAGQDWIGLAALWAVVTAYNLFKPFHIDDAAHLEIARWIMGHPWRPMSGLLNWSGVEEPIHKTNQPHLYFYLLALWGRLFGLREPAMHALQSLSALACILLFHRLARILARPLALWATALLILGPAFIVEQNLMVDTPLLAAWLVFFTPLICDVASPRQTRRYLIAAIACAAAILVKYSSLVLFPVLCLSLLLERRRAQAWTVLIPIAALAAWSLFNFLDYGGVHVAARVASSGETWRTPRFLADWLIALGGLTPLGLIAGLEGRPARRIAQWPYVLIAATFAALACAVALGLVADRAADRLLGMAFAANSALVLWALAPDAVSLSRSALWRAEVARASAPKLYLALWIAGTSAFYVLFSPFVAARHLLLILPPVTLLLASRWGGKLGRGAKAFGLAATVVVSAGLCLSDWRFADFYRREAQSLGRLTSPTRTVWVSGHWGFQWYGEQEGLREVDVRASRFAPGDLLAIAPSAAHQPLQNPPPVAWVRTDVEAHPLLNLVCTGRPVRFYMSSHQQGPWSLSRRCEEQVEVFRIRPRP